MFEEEDNGPTPEELNEAFGEGETTPHRGSLIRGIKKQGARDFAQYLKDKCAGDIDPNRLVVHLKPVPFDELDRMVEEFVNN